jgi:hypothetical protein
MLFHSWRLYSTPEKASKWREGMKSPWWRRILIRSFKSAILIRVRSHCYLMSGRYYSWCTFWQSFASGNLLFQRNEKPCATLALPWLWNKYIICDSEQNNDFLFLLGKGNNMRTNILYAIRNKNKTKISCLLGKGNNIRTNILYVTEQNFPACLERETISGPS